MSTDKGKQQHLMHKDFFDQARKACRQGFYFETIMLCYAALEGRLEVMMELLGAPCHRGLPDEQRRNIKISQRVKCAKAAYALGSALNGKWTSAAFKELDDWLVERNRLVHGLYKNVEKYDFGKAEVKNLAEAGLELTRLLYREIERLKGLIKKTPQINIAVKCKNENCKKSVT
jgi:hypothetical protein